MGGLGSMHEFTKHPELCLYISHLKVEGTFYRKTKATATWSCSIAACRLTSRMSLRVIITNFNLWLTQLPFWSKYSHSELLVACFSFLLSWTMRLKNISIQDMYNQHTVGVVLPECTSAQVFSVRKYIFLSFHNSAENHIQCLKMQSSKASCRRDKMPNRIQNKN